MRNLEYWIQHNQASNAMTTSIASGPRRVAPCHVRKLTNRNRSLNRWTQLGLCSRFNLASDHPRSSSKIPTGVFLWMGGA